MFSKQLAMMSFHESTTIFTAFNLAVSTASGGINYVASNILQFSRFMQV